jgi:hypothetical protein
VTGLAALAAAVLLGTFGLIVGACYVLVGIYRAFTRRSDR